MKHLIGCVLFWFLFSCAQVDSQEKELEGTYVGYYHYNKQDTAQVTLVFQGNHYAGNSRNERYPFVGNGSFHQKDSSITFFNLTLNQDEPDSTLALRGQYKYEVTPEGCVRIWQQSGNVLEEFMLRQLLR